MKKFEMMARRSVSITAGAMVVVFLFNGMAPAQAAFPKKPGVWLSGDAEYKLTDAHVEELTRSLRRIAGFSELHFAKDGLLSLDAAQSSKSAQSGQSAQSSGSATARQVLSSALGSGAVF